MAHILLIETATDVCSVAVARDGVVVSIRETGRSYSHSEVITLFVEQCLAEAGIAPADLVAVAVTSGPGSYTALRIGSSTAKGMCYALDIPLISVDTLYHDIECSAASMVYDAFAKWQSGDIEDTAYFTPFYFKAPNITVQKKNILIR